MVSSTIMKETLTAAKILDTLLVQAEGEQNFVSLRKAHETKDKFIEELDALNIEWEIYTLIGNQMLHFTFPKPFAVDGYFGHAFVIKGHWFD